MSARALQPGQVCSIRGVRGRYKFMRLNKDGSGAFYGGRTGYGMHRDFTLDRVTRVHRPPKT